MSAGTSDTSAASTPAFISALIVGVVMVGVWTTAFLVLHRKYPRVYQARLELAGASSAGAAGEKRAAPPRLEGSPIAWWRRILTERDQLVLEMNGPDAFFFLRFLKVFGIWMLGPYIVLTVAILIPVAATSDAGQTGLNKITYGNVGNDQSVRRVAFFLVAILLICWTLFLLFREYTYFMRVRQQWLAAPERQQSARSRTVMLVNVPRDLMSESAMRECAQSVNCPHVQRVWLARDVKKMQKVWEDRDSECARLEGAEAKMLKKAAKNEKKGKTPRGKEARPDSASNQSAAAALSDPERADVDSILDKYLSPKEKGKITWKQGFLGLLGTKMDRKQSPAFIRAKNEELAKQRADMDSLDHGNVAWVRFSSQVEAHTFARVIAHSKDKSRKLIKSSIELVPEDVEWRNTSMNPHERRVRKALSWTATITLILFWTIPVAFVGIVSNVSTLCTTVPFLSWLCINVAVEGIIQGILPPVALAVLFMLLPIVLRIWIRLQGETRKSEIELDLFRRFWLFQVIQGFLIITLSSGLISALSNISETAGQVPTLLATKLPNASIFFLTFILATTFSSAAQAASRAIPSVMFMLRGILAGNTPRKFWASQTKMQSFMWATTWPPICLLVCITIVYSCIQPIICVVAVVGFALLLAGNKYILGWLAQQPDELETGGLFYPKALRTVFVSLYIEEIFLAALFFLSTDQNGKRAPSGLAGGVLMVIMIVITAAFQFYIDRRFNEPAMLYSTASLIGGTQSTTKLTTQPTHDGTEEAAAAAANGEPVDTVDHPRAFDHPAMWKDQPIIWIAQDPFGIADAEVSRLTNEEVNASCQYAHMDRDGKLSVERNAPDEPEESVGGPIKL